MTLKQLIRNRLNLWRNRSRVERKLEIGPGSRRLDGFETLNIVHSGEVDYLYDAASKLPFQDGTFSVVYASHILEHVPWYQTEKTLAEWVRIVASQGSLELWVPDGLKICQTLVEFETQGVDRTGNDGWYRFNDDRDPCRWAAGRLYTYGDGKGTLDSPNWHRALFTERFLRRLMEGAGLVDVRRMTNDEVRGYDHGWINLGMKGMKP